MIAAILGLSKERVRHLAQEGMPRIGTNLYPLAGCVQWYVEYWRRRADGRDDEGRSLTTRAKEAQVKLVEARAGQAAGTHVSKLEVAQTLEDAYMQLGAFLERLPTALGRDCNLSPEVQRKMRARLDDARRNFARDLSEYLKAAEKKRHAVS